MTDLSSCTICARARCWPTARQGVLPAACGGRSSPISGVLGSVSAAAARSPAACWFERSRAGGGSGCLVAKEFDVQQIQLHGHQADTFVHAALLLERALPPFSDAG